MDQEEMARTGAHFHRESLLKSRFQTGSALDTAQKSHVTRMEKHFCIFSVRTQQEFSCAQDREKLA